MTKIFIFFTLAYTFRSAFDIIYVTAMSESDLTFLVGQIGFMLSEIVPITLMYNFHYNSSRKLRNWAVKARAFSCHSNNSPKESLFELSTSIDFEYSVFPGS